MLDHHDNGLKHVMFDIDGTLIQSYDFDDDCYKSAIEEVTGIDIKDDWSTYPHVTDRGILMTFIERQAPHWNLSMLEPQVKSSFIQKISEHLNHSPAQEIDGARKFLAQLNGDRRFTVSLATGGWRETALLKLESAEFDTNKLVLSSSSEHHSRTEVMKLSAKKVGDIEDLSFTYFGDAEWDVRACNELNVNLVIIGNRAKHPQQLMDFTNYDKLMSFIM